MEHTVFDPIADFTWLYRGVPIESPEVLDAQAIGEIHPPRPERIGETWRHQHVHGNTQTGYTSWTTDRSIAEEAARFKSNEAGLSGRIVVLRIRVDSLSDEKLFYGLDDESEWLIQGPVEDVSISESEAADEEDSYD